MNYFSPMRNFVTYEWFTIFIIFGTICIVLAKFTNSLRFQDFLYVVGNSKYLKIYSRQQKFIDQFDSFLFLNLALSTSIFIFFAYSAFVSPLSFELIPFSKLLLAVSTLIIIKILVERLIGSLFEIDALIDNYLFQKITFKNYSGLVLLVANLFLIYSKIRLDIIIFTAISIVCLINFMGFLTSFRSHQKSINANFFYFLLYLCALEIGPYVLLYKAIREYNA